MGPRLSGLHLTLFTSINLVNMGESDKKPPAGDGSYKKKWISKKKHYSEPAAQPEKFQGGKDELDGNYFDCTGYGQPDRFVKTVQKMAGYSSIVPSPRNSPHPFKNPFVLLDAGLCFYLSS
jgi:hypothetical protein